MREHTHKGIRKSEESKNGLVEEKGGNVCK